MNIKKLTTEELDDIILNFEEICRERRSRIPKPDYVGNPGDCYVKQLDDMEFEVYQISRIYENMADPVFCGRYTVGGYFDISFDTLNLTFEDFKNLTKVDSSLYDMCEKAVKEINEKYAKMLDTKSLEIVEFIKNNIIEEK